MSDDARRLALRISVKARLLAMHVPAFAIGRWCTAWEAEADRQGLEVDAESWMDGIRWIVDKVAAGEDPPTPGEDGELSAGSDSEAEVDTGLPPGF